MVGAGYPFSAERSTRAVANSSVRASLRSDQLSCLTFFAHSDPVAKGWCSRSQARALYTDARQRRPWPGRSPRGALSFLGQVNVNSSPSNGGIDIILLSYARSLEL